MTKTSNTVLKMQIELSVISNLLFKTKMPCNISCNYIVLTFIKTASTYLSSTVVIFFCFSFSNSYDMRLLSVK